MVPRRKCRYDDFPSGRRSMPWPRTSPVKPRTTTMFPLLRSAVLIVSTGRRLDRNGVRESERRAGRVELLNVERRAGAEFEWPEIDERRLPVGEVQRATELSHRPACACRNDPGFAGDRGDRSGAIVQIGEEVVGPGRGGEIKSEARRLRSAEFRPVDVARRDERWRKRPRLLLVDIGVMGPPTEGDIAVHQRDAVEGGK